MSDKNMKCHGFSNATMKNPRQGKCPGIFVTDKFAAKIMEL